MTSIDIIKKQVEQLEKDLVNANKDFILTLLKGSEENIIKLLPDYMQNDKEVILAIIANYPTQLKYTSAELRVDSEFLLSAGKYNKNVLYFASLNLLSNKEFVLKAIDAGLPVLTNLIGSELQEDREIVLEAVKKRPNDFAYTKNIFRSDREIALIAINHDALNIKYASSELQNDKEIVLKIFSQKNTSKPNLNTLFALKYVDEFMFQERDVMLEFCKRCKELYDFTPAEL